MVIILRGRRCGCSGLCLLTAAAVGLSAVCAEAQSQLRIDQVILKGTHNSYSCKGECGIVSCENDPPWMSHPPYKQVDAFGAWAVELDCGANVVGGVVRAVVGHDGPNHTTCSSWGGGTGLLSDYLLTLRATRAFQYRPIILYADYECGNDWQYDPDCTAVDAYALLTSELLRVFAADKIFGPDAFVAYDELNGDSNPDNDVYPTIPELAGMIIPMRTGPTTFGVGNGYVYGPASAFALERTQLFYNDCTELSAVGDDIATGGHVLKLDQYQTDWTFELGVPPNPLVVDYSAAGATTVVDAEGEEWCMPFICACPNGDAWGGNVVHQQGTFAVSGGSGFPFSTVSAAVVRARGIVPDLPQDARRAGYGWTVLIRPGIYAEVVTIDIPLTLKRDDSYTGTVVIGQ